MFVQWSRFQRARAGLAAASAPAGLPALIPGPFVERQARGVDQSNGRSHTDVTPSFGTHDMTARKVGSTVGYCDKAVRIRENEHGHQG
ncbi:hypothetical protein GCM10010244_44770 [Streptomyces coeruleorubidus]|nr:hypothetical protein GCM10010244_44770 [Streptomyces bellus]